MKKDKLVFPRTKENQFGNNLRSQFRICVNQYSLEQPPRHNGSSYFLVVRFHVSLPQ